MVYIVLAFILVILSIFGHDIIDFFKEYINYRKRVKEEKKKIADIENENDEIDIKATIDKMIYDAERSNPGKNHIIYISSNIHCRMINEYITKYYFTKITDMKKIIKYRTAFGEFDVIVDKKLDKNIIEVR